MDQPNHLLELNIGIILGFDYVQNNNQISEVLKVTTTTLLFMKNYMEDFAKFMKANKIKEFEDIVKMYPALY